MLSNSYCTINIYKSKYKHSKIGVLYSLGLVYRLNTQCILVNLTIGQLFNSESEFGKGNKFEREGDKK